MNDGIESKSGSMNGFEPDRFISPEIFTEFGHVYIHTSAQIKIILAPNLNKNFFPRQKSVWIFTQE